MSRFSVPFHLAGALLLITALELRAQAATAGWRLVYAVDSAGKAMQGTKDRLLDAVRAGLPVRVGWGIPYRLPDGTAGGLEHFAPAAFLTIHQGEVLAQIPPILGQTPSAREPSIAFRTDDDQLWYALLDTRGRLLSYFTRSGRRPETVRVATYWYVDGDAKPGTARLY